MTDNPKGATTAERWDGDENIESPFNACMHRGYCLSLKQATPAAAAEMAQPATPEPMKLHSPEEVQMLDMGDFKQAVHVKANDPEWPEFKAWREEYAKHSNSTDWAAWQERARRAAQPPAATPAPAELFDALMDHAQAHAKNGRWTTRLVFDLIQRAYAAGRSATPAPAAEIVPLTDEQIERHTLLASHCPPDSKVLLVSSVRRLRAAIATQAAPEKDSKDLLGVPASPSRSSLQPPSSASAAIPDAPPVTARELYEACAAEFSEDGEPWSRCRVKREYRNYAVMVNAWMKHLREHSRGQKGTKS